MFFGSDQQRRPPCLCFADGTEAEARIQLLVSDLADKHHTIHGGHGKHGLWGMGSTLVLQNKRRWVRGAGGLGTRHCHGSGSD